MDVLTQMLNLGINSAGLKSAPHSAAALADTHKKTAPFSGAENAASIHVDLSPLGIQKSKNADRDKDIEESELPDNVKRSLKMIRDQQEKLEEMQQELQKLMSDNSIPSDEKQQKMKFLQAEISSLSRTITDAKSNLIKAMQDQGLTDQQMQTAMALMN